MGSLTAAAEQLSACLEKAQADLRSIAHRLEADFEKRSSGVQVNILTQISKLRRLERQLPEVQAECTAVLAEKQNLIDAAKRQLIGNKELVDSLCVRAGMPPRQGSSEVLQGFEAALREWDAKVGLAAPPGASDPELSRKDLNNALMSSVLEAV